MRLQVERHDRLAVGAGERGGQLADAVRRDRDELPHLDGRGAVRDADEDEAHQEKWVRGRPRRATATSANPARTT